MPIGAYRHDTLKLLLRSFLALKSCYCTETIQWIALHFKLNQVFLKALIATGNRGGSFQTFCNPLHSNPLNHMFFQAVGLCERPCTNLMESRVF